MTTQDVLNKKNECVEKSEEAEVQKQFCLFASHSKLE